MIQKDKIGVLVFPAGEVNAVELHDALSACVNIRLYGASSLDRHGGYVFRDYTSGLPMISDPEFIEALNRLIAEKEIHVIFPTHDTAAEFLSIHQPEINAKVIVADAWTAGICRDKKRTFELFRDCGFCPRVDAEVGCYPVFVKPRRGQGAVGAFLLTGEEDIPSRIDWEDMVICEYLPGEELTVDCITDREGSLRGVFPRSRKRILAGMTVNGSSELLSDEIWNIADKINSRLHFLGLWYFQVRKSADGQFKLMEISTRCSGTMCLTRARGVNLPLLSVYTAVGRDISVFCNDYQVVTDRTLIARYQIDYAYERVYMDLDDTLTVNGTVCLNMIRFVYQCRNQGIPIILLTRHSFDHEESTEEYLSKCCIMTDLFEEICSISFEQQKADFIRPKGAIFIDNSFAERKAVHDRFNIPVFDVDGIEVLLDWRV